MKALTDTELEQAIGQMLRAGVLAAALVVVAGAALFLHAQGRTPRPDYTHFHAQVLSLRDIGGVFARARRGDGASIIHVGLLLLVATPVARVVLAGAGFMLERDWLYAGVSALVLMVLMYSLLFGS